MAQHTSDTDTDTDTGPERTFTVTWYADFEASSPGEAMLLAYEQLKSYADHDTLPPVLEADDGTGPVVRDLAKIEPDLAAPGFKLDGLGAADPGTGVPGRSLLWIASLAEHFRHCARTGPGRENRDDH
ncbi:hypothetical protein ACWD0J_20915 [Streptomyces sp. NPDC003011]